MEAGEGTGAIRSSSPSFSQKHLLFTLGLWRAQFENQIGSEAPHSESQGS